MFNDLEPQARVWDLQSRQPNPIVLFGDVVNDTWTLLYTVPEATFVEVREILMYNGDAATRIGRIAVINPLQAAPSGASTNQLGIYYSRSLATDVSDRTELTLGLSPGWKIYGYSTAASPNFFNVLISGLVVSYLS